MVDVARVVVVYGTRPELIKLAPVVHVLEGYGYPYYCLSTQQHPDLLLPLERYFNVRPHVAIAKQRPDPLPARAGHYVRALSEWFQSMSATVVVGQGDTLSAWASAVAAFLCDIPFVHVEAGLRTYARCSPWPEEGLRRMITPIAAWHCAPTQADHAAILSEMPGVPADHVVCTGNTVVDAAAYAIDRMGDAYDEKYKHLDNRDVLLVTGHRRENIDSGLAGVVRAVCDLAYENPGASVVWVGHPNPAVNKTVKDAFAAELRSSVMAATASSIQIVPPVEYEEFLYLMRRASCIISDSGGVQEEATVVRTPVFVTRDHTERPQACDAGFAVLVGCASHTVKQAVSRYLNDASSDFPMRGCPFGGPQGTPARDVVDVIDRAAS